MKEQCFRLVWCRLNGYEFRLAWNGFSMIGWNQAGIDGEKLFQDTAMMANALHIMGQAAAAVLRHCSYPPDEVPSAAELEQHLMTVAVQWERSHAFDAILSAIRCSNERSYMPDSAQDDIDTIELKKKLKEMGIFPDGNEDGENAFARYASLGVRCGLSIAETMHAPVGFVIDLWEAYQQANMMIKEG